MYVPLFTSSANQVTDMTALDQSTVGNISRSGYKNGEAVAPGPILYLPLRSCVLEEGRKLFYRSDTIIFT